MKKILFSLAFLGFTSLGFAQKNGIKPDQELIKRFQIGKLEYSRMSKLAEEVRAYGEPGLAQKIANNYINNYLFKLKDIELFTKEHLIFMGSFLGDKTSKAFKFFMKEPEKINAVLGHYKAQNMVMDFIDKKYLPQGDFNMIKHPNWDKLEKIVASKFGNLGRERIYGQRMLYHWCLKDDWQQFAKYYMLYFKSALEHTRYHLNNMSWPIFEHINDPVILEFAIEVMKYDLVNYDQEDTNAYDTYANLLYKTGKRNQAIEWEEKAIKLSNNNKELLETLEKMKNNERTWQETANK